MSIKKIQFSAAKVQENIEIEDNEFVNDDLIVKFQITDTQIIAHSYNKNKTISEIKSDIGLKFKINESALDLKQNEQLLEDESETLENLDRNQFGIVELELKLNESGLKSDLKLDLNVYYSHAYSLPEIITVNVPGEEGEDGQEKKILVEIENKQVVKPFLGGFRNIRTNARFHNATTQTGPMKIKYDGIFSRETQTEPGLLNTLRTTRTPKNEIRPFVTSDEMVDRMEKLKKVKIIQKNFRLYKWRKLIRESAEQWRLIQQKAKEKKHYDTSNADYNKVMRLLFMAPKNRDDFNEVYLAVQNWKRAEILRIKDLHYEGSYIAELNLILEREIELLNEIEKRKEEVKKEFKKKNTERVLNQMGGTTKFIGHGNKVLEIDTIRSQKIRFWSNFYTKLKEEISKKEDRLKLLDDLIGHLETEDYKGIDDLRELFDRERSMWELNFGPDEMDNLRARQLFLLFEFIKTVHQSDAVAKKESRICERCKKLLPSEELVILCRKNIRDICKKCNSLRLPAQEQNVYREILRSIRREEKRRGALASFAFIIQEDDIRFLIENIWHGHSILSQNSNRNLLRLPRWTYNEDWAPWNCICLTESEAKTHVKLRQLDCIYENHLMNIVKSRNNLALTTFHKLKEIDYEFVESGQWWSAGLKQNE